jgi:hypothetical protein
MLLPTHYLSLSSPLYSKFLNKGFKYYLPTPMPWRWRGMSKAVFVKLVNTNSSPLWSLKPEILDDREALKDSRYFKQLGSEKGATLVIYLGQADGPSGLLMLDEEGNIIGGD